MIVLAAIVLYCIGCQRLKMKVTHKHCQGTTGQEEQGSAQIMQNYRSMVLSINIAEYQARDWLDGSLQDRHHRPGNR